MSFLQFVPDFVALKEESGEESSSSSPIDLSDSEVAASQASTPLSPLAYDHFLTPETMQKSAVSASSEVFQGLSLYHRLNLTKNFLANIGDKWDEITREADMDIDRRALDNLPKPEPAVSKSAFDDAVRAHLLESSSARLKAAWRLVDSDADGMLEEDEMNRAVELYRAPAEKSVEDFVKAVIESLHEDKENKIGTKAHKKQLNKTLARTIKRCYFVENEAPHRLRCIYAWADKAHQDGTFNAVRVSDDITGRKRYVELLPKISFEEFLEIQKEQFELLDKFGESYMTSLREELWVKQGLGRQNRELMWQCAGFFVLVSVLDYATLIV